MKKLFNFISIFCILSSAGYAQVHYVQAKGGQFSIGNQPYYFIGTNYWYGGLLALGSEPEKGKQRLISELNFLQGQGVNNLRVLVGSEGTGKINGVERVSPALQPEKGRFDPAVLKGLDILLVEMAKRKMYAVLYLSNNWEWSGGFLQYLNWYGGLERRTMERKLSWAEQSEYTSRFYSCQDCTSAYAEQLAFIIGHKNTINGKRYASDPTIMAWEIANEPRPMRAEAIPDYERWLSKTASDIRRLDANHLITIGSEGSMGSENQMALYERIHSDPNVDYLTIHIWPKNWSWFKGVPSEENLKVVIEHTKTYIGKHLKVARRLVKPLVIEEFGLPRDGHAFGRTATTALRDQYFETIFAQWAQSRKSGNMLAGCNFWSYGGLAQLPDKRIFWMVGDDFSGDPPQEEQGLNSVFTSDRSTWKVVSSFLDR